MVRTLRPWRDTRVRPMEDLCKEMDHLVSHLFSDSTRDKKTSFAPRVNIVETETGYEVSADLPGITPDDVSVELHEGQLTISGSREQEAAEEGKTFHRVERSYGEFKRVITIPEQVDEESIQADYANGVLTVLLPKSEKLKPTRIAINTASKN